MLAHHELVEKLRAGLSQVLRGKGAVVDLALMGIFAGGHVLLEDVPGVGKTTLAKSLARVFGVRFTRVQFTPDLLPGDITGSLVLNPERGTFSFQRGPIFTNILLADEINRASPRTQAALLEAMNESQVTVDGETHPLEAAVLRRRHPEPRGLPGHLPAPGGPARSLPRARLHRVPEPGGRARDALRAADEGPARRPRCALHAGESLVAIQEAVRNVEVKPLVARYLLAIVEATRAIRSSPSGSARAARCRSFAPRRRTRSSRARLREPGGREGDRRRRRCRIAWASATTFATRAATAPRS